MLPSEIVYEEVLPSPLAVFLVISANAQKSPKISKESKGEECSIAGMVAKMAGSAPPRKARLVLQSYRGQNPQRLNDNGCR